MSNILTVKFQSEIQIMAIKKMLEAIFEHKTIYPGGWQRQ